MDAGLGRSLSEEGRTDPECVAFSMYFPESVSSWYHVCKQPRRVKLVDGYRLRNLRERRFWSQQELARRSGVSRITVTRIETGAVVPTLMTVRRLAEAMGVDPVEIAPDPSALRPSGRAARPARNAMNGGTAK